MADADFDGLTDAGKIGLIGMAVSGLIDKVEEQDDQLTLFLDHVTCLVDQLDQLKRWYQSGRPLGPPEALGTLYPVDDRRAAEILVASQRAHGRPVSDFLAGVAEGKITEESIAEAMARKGD